MATVREPVPRASASADVVTVVLLIVGATQVIVGLLLFIAPGTFYDALASYPPENHHFLKDLGSWQIGLGALILYGARRPAWRLPLLGIVGLQYALHTLAHIIDVGDSTKSGQDAFAIATQGLGAVVLIGLFFRERSR